MQIFGAYTLSIYEQQLSFLVLENILLTSEAVHEKYVRVWGWVDVQESYMAHDVLCVCLFVCLFCHALGFVGMISRGAGLIASARTPSRGSG